MSGADTLALGGYLLISVGSYFPWIYRVRPATLEAYTPWDLAGLYPGRSILILFAILYLVIRILPISRFGEAVVLGLSGIAGVFYPIHRFFQAPVEGMGHGSQIAKLVPAIGFYITVSGGVLLIAAGAYGFAMATTRQSGNDVDTTLP